jgi:hypothetical protein
MTPQQKIKWVVLNQVAEWAEIELSEINSENVDEIYDQYYYDEEDRYDDYFHDAKNEIRCGDVETEIDCDWSRHYESKSVAALIPDGSWVGWTYWYGGGKCSEPEAIDWIEDAYDLNCTEYEKTINVREFTKVKESSV